MNWGNQRGAVFPLILVLMIFFIALLAVFMPLMTNETHFSSYNVKWVSARYAAEAAAKYAIHQIQTILNTGTTPTTAQCSTITSSLNGSKIAANSQVTITATCKPDNAIEPTVYYIRVTGAYGNTTARANVNFYLSNSPLYDAANVVDLINTGTYSHTDHNPKSNNVARWTITTDNDPNTPDTADSSNQVEVCQVMFNDLWDKDTIDVKYKAKAYTKGGKSVDGGGYGIYYGMIGNADNMNAYVLQWDPGARYDKSGKYSSSTYNATYGTLLVKKVIADPGNYTNSSSSNFSSLTSSNGPGAYERNEWGYDSGDNESYYALPFQSANSGETLRVPICSSDDSTANGTSLETLMNNYYNSIGSSTVFNVTAVHTIGIKTEYSSDDGNLWHYIYVDDNPNPILKFYDHSTNKINKNDSKAKYKASSAADYVLNGKAGGSRTFKGTHTGIRIWDKDVNVSFTNADESTQVVAKSIVWVR